MKKPIAATLFAAVLGLAALAPARAANPATSDSLTMADFNHSIKLMVNGYTGTETLENFPVLVRVSESGIPGFHFADMSAKNVNGKALGYDLAFFAENGTRLEADQDTWDIDKTVGTTGEMLVWVKLPTMTQETKFYMCYNVSDGVYVTNANPWTEYVGVWHMKEASGTVADSTINSLDATPGGTTANSIAVDGKLGKARQNAVFGANGNLTVPSYSSVYNGTAFTVSGWFYQVAYNANDSRLFSRKTNYNVAGGWETFSKTVLNSDKTPREGGRLDTRGQKNDKTYQSDANIDLKKMGWTHLAFTYNGASATMYTNGAVVAASGPIHAPTDNGLALGIGNYNTGTGNASFFGYIDECRLLPSTASADWVKAEYDTVNNPFFVTNAPIAVLDVLWAEASGRSGVTNIAWNAAVVGGIVTSLGEGASEAAIEGKFWVDGDAEPAEWTTLTNGLGPLDAFGITVPCQPNTTYNYKLCGVDDNGRTSPIMGTFTTPIGLAVTWAEKSSRAGVTNVLSHIAVIGGTIDALDSAPSVTIEGKFWTGETEPTVWTALGEPLSQTGDFSLSVSGLEIDHFYSYKLQAKGSNGFVVSPVSGTFMTGHGLAIHWAGSVEQPGVTNIAWNAVVVGGAVESMGDDPTCSLEGKFWVDGATEPTGWQTLGTGDFGLGDFSVSVPNLAENTTYRYKLRATETDGSETPAASGSFTTPVGLAAAWADDVAGRPGVTAVGVFSATVGGSVECLGDSSTCTVEGKFWTGETEPTDWTTLGGSLSQTGAFTATAPNLAGGTAYRYKLRLAGSNGVATAPVTGTFTTDPALTVAWSTATASAGIASLGYGFVAVGGQVTALGEATVCSVQSKIWIAGGTEPDEWTTLKDRLGLNGTFSVNVPDLAAGTTYRYELRAVGDDGEATVPVSSSFTTPGESGEEIGSEWTHFFDDGTNAVWVADGFERYLPFTVTGYTGSETLTNFPVLVEVRSKDTNGFSYDDFYHYDGKDIVFVDEKGHIIPHEIDTWNKNGMSLFWVRLPEMKNGTTFTMCYRSPLLKTPPDPGNTFERYVGVWHMNEKGDGVVNLKDSTVNDFETETHAQSLYASSGRIGGARQVAQNPGSAASYGRIIAFDHDDILRTGVGNVFTYSGWYKLLEQPPKWAYLVSRKSEDADRGWGVQYQETGTAQLRVWSGSRSKSGFNGQTFSFSNTGTDWHYWTFVFDGNGPFGPGTNGLFYAYLDGEIVKSVANGLPLKYDIANDETADYDNLCVVGQQNGTGAFKGLVDEARYSKGIRSADWIRAEYLSTMQAQWWNTDKRFVTKGTVSRGEDSRVPVVVWERGSGLPDTILDVSYAYVQFAGTVTYCGSGATNCWVEYQLWVDGESQPETWTTLASDLRAGQYFSIPVTGLKQDTLYNFRIRAVALVDGELRQNHDHTGQFRTNGNLELGNVDGELLRLGDKFVHRYRAGSWTFTTPDYVTNIEIMVVGGGGAGGYKVGGGGGGGGLFYSASYPVTTSTVYRINVGEGGTAPSDVSTHSEIGNGQHSYFALGSDEGHPLIFVPGGGGGGSYANNADVATGADGGSGGGGTYAKLGGTATDDGAYGHDGGRGNDTLQGGAIGKVAAGGGGGAGRAGLGATFDSWSTGGSGGVGVANSMTGETLFYGAGGGGGYIYRMETAQDGTDNFSKPGGGGSGIGGNAADVRNGTPATSGVENTGAGGGGGSSKGSGKGDVVDETDSTYWQGGDGGDGVVLISYEAHGRDPVSEEPRISMTDCLYTDERGYAIIDYRAYWAGIQSQLNDIYVLYSTVSEEDVLAGNGEMVKCAEGKIGIGWLKFTPPEKGHTYWVRLVARKDANSFMYSDEIASFEAPAIRINGVTWTESKATEISAPDTSKDFATVLYDVYDTDPDALLYCYWSENRADLEGDAEPSGEGVHFLNVTTDIIENGDTLVDATRFRVSAALGLERNKQYYFRLALANEAGTKFNLSPRIMPLWTAETAYVVYPQAVWSNHVVTADFMLSPAHYDPASVELLALYSGVQKDITDGKAIEKESVKTIKLGTTDQYPHGDQTLTQFPLSSTETTNYFTRLALKLPDGKYVYSARYQEVIITTHIPENTILITARAIPQKRCYGDEPPAFDYEVTYAGYTNTVAWEHRPTVVGELACVTITDDPADAEPVTSQSPSGQYRIIQNTLALSNPEPYVHTVTEPVVDPVTGEQMIDSETHEPMTQTVTTEYEFMFAYARARYTITNAVFSAAVEDISATYTGEAFEPSELRTSESGVRNNQAVSYKFRPVADDKWNDGISASYTDVGTHSFEFMATAANHEATYGLFTVKIEPAPLKATISDVLLNYNGEAQTPEVETNVTGLVNGEINPLTCVFRDEAGEWQADVPSFTNPGEYVLYFKAEAPNHAPAVASCTVTVEGWDYRVNLDGQTGYQTEIFVTDPGWLLRTSGRTSEEFADAGSRYAALDEVCANGLRLWQNYVLQRDDLSRKLVAAVMQNGDRVPDNSFVVHFPNVEALRNTGLSVGYRLDRKLVGESAFTQGEVTDKYETAVPLGPGDPSGLYAFHIVLTPTNDPTAGRSVLPSVTTAGVLRVTSSLANTVTAVPWASMARAVEAEEPVRVADVVNPNGLSEGDEILAYDTSADVFRAWTHGPGNAWNAVTTVAPGLTTSEEADAASFARGGAFWLVRSDSSGPFFLVGRHADGACATPIAPGSAAAPASTLCANPTGKAISFKDLVFNGEIGADDTIVVTADDGIPSVYVWNASKNAWGYWRKTLVGRRIQSTWVEDGSVAPGMGFWYIRRSSGTLSITWPAFED